MQRTTSAVLALLLNLTVQYFAKLYEALPWGLLGIGFGLFLLAVAVGYEKQVKHMLPRLREWA